MRIRDKIITAACLAPNGIEWTSVKIKQDGTESAGQGTMPLTIPEEPTTEAAMSTVQLPDGIADQLVGDITASIRTNELLMRTMEFPSTDPAEIAGMVPFQIDKVSPFPVDQLAVSHEILTTTEESSLVLMVAARRSCIDTIGDTFGAKGIHIHSMDARVLGWLHLLRQNGHVKGEGTEILIIDDGIDFALAVLKEGAPLAFRSIDTGNDDADLPEELAHEIAYTLTMLDAEHDDLPAPASIEYWSHEALTTADLMTLKLKTGIDVHNNDLSVLPPLSEGIIDRAINLKHRIELIPREWIEHERNKRLRRKFTIIAASITGLWFVFILIFTGIYQTRAIRLASVRKKANTIAPLASKAMENRRKLKALTIHSDRSTSALECLREVTRLLPAGDIEFVTYNYTKGKGVTLRGTSEIDTTAYEFFNALADSAMFKDMKNQSVNTRENRGESRAVFNVMLELPYGEDEE